MANGSFDELTTPEQLLDYLKDTKARTKNYSTLYHYTTVDSLIKILQSKIWLLSNATRMNDLTEIEYGDKTQWSHLHYSCLSSEEKENIGMWSMYSQPWEKGVKLSFSSVEIRKWIAGTKQVIQLNPTSLEKESVLELKLSQLSLGAVAYCNVDSLQKEETEVVRWSRVENKKIKGAIHQPCLTGYVKNQAWSYEKEFRILADLKEDIPFRLALDIPDSILDTLIVTTSPLFEGDLKEIIKRETGLTINVEPSLFENRLQVNSPCKSCEYKKEKMMG